jgi:hypothetical protein
MNKLKVNSKGHARAESSEHMVEAIRAARAASPDPEEFDRKFWAAEPLHKLLLPEHWEFEEFD